MRTLVVAGTVVAFLAGCATGPVEGVRLVTDVNDVKGCTLVSMFHEGDYRRFPHKVAAQGGNVGRVTDKEVYAFPWSIDRVVEVYRCPNAK